MASWLHRAADWSATADESAFTVEFDQPSELSAFLRCQAEQARMGAELDRDRLLRVFLPTADWDSLGGPQRIANEICARLGTR